MIEDVRRHSQNTILSRYDLDDLDKAKRSGLYQATDEYFGEDGFVKSFSIKSQKRKIVDKIPSQIGCAILQWSKLLFLRYFKSKRNKLSFMF